MALRDATNLSDLFNKEKVAELTSDSIGKSKLIRVKLDEDMGIDDINRALTGIYDEIERINTILTGPSKAKGAAKNAGGGLLGLLGVKSKK